MNKRDQVRQLEENRYSAMMAGDIETIAAMLDPELVYVHSTGLRDDRDAYLQALRDGMYTYEKIEIKNSSSIESTDMVVVSTLVRATMRLKGHANSVTKDVEILSVWRASGNRWLMVAMQSTGVV